MTLHYALCNYLILLLKFHCQALYRYLDPLLDDHDLEQMSQTAHLSNHPFLKPSTSKWSFIFTFPVVIILTTLLIGNFYLVFWSTAEDPNLTQIDQLLNLQLLLLNSPRLMTHQAFPRAMWPQMDIAFTMAATFSVVSYLTFLRNPYTVDRYQPTRVIPPSDGDNVDKDDKDDQGDHEGDLNYLLKVSGQLLSSAESKRITAFHNFFHRPAFSLSVALAAFGAAFCLVHVLLINANFELTVVEVLLWALLFPLTIFYMVYILFAITLFLVLTCRFEQIRQRHLLDQLRQLFRRQSRRLDKRRLRGKRRESDVGICIFDCWLQYEQLNVDLLRLCGHLLQTSTYWSPFLSVYFGSQIVLQCYVVYICFFIPSLPPIVKLLATACFAVFLSLLFAMISTCAQLAAGNDRLEQANGRFCFQIASASVSMGGAGLKNGVNGGRGKWCRLLIKVKYSMPQMLLISFIKYYSFRPSGSRPVAVWSRTVWYYWTTTQSHRKLFIW